MEHKTFIQASASPKDSRVQTTIRIPTTIHCKLKIISATRNMTINDLVIEMVEDQYDAMKHNLPEL